MKKIFLLITAAVVSAGIMSAQDINQATENYNNGAMELDMGNKEAALTCFQTALTMAEALGDEGAELAANCKNIIPNVMLSLAKDFIKADNFDGAVEQLNKTAEAAELYGAPETAAEAKDMIPTVYLSKGNGLLKAKDVAGATAAFQQVLALDPTNGMASLLLGQALTAQGKVAEAEAAYLQAAENGQETNAKKQLSKMYLKLAQAALKGKKSQDAYDHAVKANSFIEDANAYKIAASAAQQLGKNADCIANYEKYLEMKPNAKDAAGVKFTIGALYQQTGNKAKAKEFYQMVVNDPQYGASAQEQLKTL
ncbi:MAG: tetratricopeptide repeat protein [Bacteroidales bacterium]|nr:tetratricopeptide repeat protein [Bacteroidales bacterium]